jgi:hypothetical protein
MWPGEPPVSKQRLALRPARYPLAHLGWRKRADEAHNGIHRWMIGRRPADRRAQPGGVNRTGRPHAEPRQAGQLDLTQGEPHPKPFRPFPQVKAPMAAAVLAARRTERAAV